MGKVKRVHCALNSHEQLMLLKQPNPRVPTGIRNLCIINLMLKAGLRVSEVLSLKNEDLDWEKGYIHIGKSGAARERTLRLEEPEFSYLEKWYRLKPNASNYVFTTLDGSQLQDRYIREMVKRLARKAGINKDVYPHLLRYTFAIEFLRKTRDINLLQLALGHGDYTATQAYVKQMFTGEDINYYAEIKDSCSGMPAVNIQQSIEVQAGIINHSKKKETKYSNYETINNDGYEEVKTKAQAKTADTYGAASGSFEPMLKPEISFDTNGQEYESKSIKIPAIKCSRCNYILRYKANCPECGVKFEDIIKHWRGYV